MGPIMIADSDEESDSNEQIVAPSPVTVPQAQTRSSEQGSLATASTDSALFQQIFNEQNAAACERALQLQLQQELEDAPHQSSAMTIPDVPFQRTTKGFYHSSLTSVTDPRSEMSRNFPAMRSSERTLERTQERTQSAVDPWEVPSSPGAPNLQEEQAKDQGGDAPDQSYGGDKSPLGADTPLENRWDDLERMEGRDKKRRRLDESEAALSQSNDVDLVMSPHESKLISTNDELETAAASSTSLPAIPIGDTNSAFQNNSSIVRSVPSDAVNGASSAIPRYNNLLLKQQTQYAVGSSGSATNINTPRNQMFSIPSFGSKDPEEQESTTTTKKIEYRNFISRRGSSPDIISAPAPDLDEVAPEPRYSPDLNPEPKVDQEYHDDRDHLADQPPLPEELTPEELPPEGSDAEFVARPTPAAKSKKKRGRPKKSLETDEPPPVKLAESPAPATDAISPVPTTQKKKRGRPKKQSDEPAVESALLAAATPTPAVRGEKKTGGKKKVTKGRKKLVVLSDSEGDHSATEDLAAEEPGGQDAVEETLKPEATEDDQKRAASGKKSKAKASLDDQTILDDKSEDEDEPKEIKKHSTLEKEERSGDKKGLSALGLAKPIYRVGLSKRSRIAPLLKSVRKA
ncbi:hypothetical protein TGAMA5MH_07758 [Trichoderma gamsii]|uniref:AT hook domain-containing protein n=1 Tax=Trichoderma gamsii TaxID=398673 RepID=A0A2K0T4H3_9HYPO|nr:hypothetical protein TGAMA5MH_07758 [Trichoderma gamsii]